MVQLTGPDGQPGRAVGERGSDRRARPRSHHNWGARLGRRREEMKLRTEPINLHELEDLARISVELMEKHSPKSDKNFEIAMDLLRQQYNLNFMIYCEECRGPHQYDELDAPER